MKKLGRKLKDRTLVIPRGTSVKESLSYANKKASGKEMKDMWQRYHVSSREDEQPIRLRRLEKILLVNPWLD